MPFENRKEAAHLLSQALNAYKGQNPLVLAIPRGAAPMARIIADSLHGEMDVVLVHKISAPFQEEFAIGAVDEVGTVYLNPAASHIPQNHIEQEKQKQLKILQQRRIQYTQVHKPPSPLNRIVIVVDDGVATGATMIAALKSLRMQHPKKLIVATAVAPLETLKVLQGLADEVVCLETPENFYAVGQFFLDFPQITDDEVIQLLRNNSAPNDPPVKIPVGSVILEGMLSLPEKAKGIVIFAHGSGSSHLSPRNQYVAQVLQQAQMGTLLFDLLTQEEDQHYKMRFNIPLLTQRLIAATQWLQKQQAIPLGYFGASTGAASALMAAAELGDEIRCVVSRGGRPDLAMSQLKNVVSPTLLIVGGLDTEVIELNQQAYDQLQVEKELAIVPGATHLFEEPGTLERAAHLAQTWFIKYLTPFTAT